jgi:hypothetical protein
MTRTTTRSISPPEPWWTCRRAFRSTELPSTSGMPGTPEGTARGKVARGPPRNEKLKPPERISLTTTLTQEPKPLEVPARPRQSAGPLRELAHAGTGGEAPLVSLLHIGPYGVAVVYNGDPRLVSRS